MTFEQSNGKARSTRTRRSDLKVPRAVGEPLGSRAAGGRFAKGNAVGRQRGIKAQLRRALGGDATNPVVEQLYRAVRVTESALRRDLPCTAPSVLVLVQPRATWSVLVPHVTKLALEAGLHTDKGRAYLELALKLDTRAERLAITSLDVATKLAEAERKRTPPTFPWMTAGCDDDEDDDAPGDASASVQTSERPEAAPGDEDVPAGQPGPATSVVDSARQRGA